MKIECVFTFIGKYAARRRQPSLKNTLREFIRNPEQQRLKEATNRATLLHPSAQAEARRCTPGTGGASALPDQT